MRNKLILFLMLALFGSTSFLRADEVTIGSLEGAANNSYLPMNSLYNYSYTQQIYTAEEIGMAGTINSITMWMYGTATLPARTFDIYMKEVDKNEFSSSTDWVTVAASDMVYSGTVAFQNTEAEPYTFELATPFTYSGNGNLLIVFNNLTGSWNSGLNGKVFGATGDPVRAIYARQDSGAYDPYNPTFTATSTIPQRNVVMLDITAGGGGGGGEAGELTVHDGTGTSSYVPAYGFYADAYLKCEMVYPAEELTAMNGGTINSVKFYASTPAAEAWTGTWQVFVAEVADAAISDFYGPGTVVYEGTLDATGEDMTITFNAPYAYNGGNLLIGVYETVIGNYKSVTWAGETVDGASVQGYSYSSLSAVSATQRNFLPKTTFAYVSGGVTPPPTGQFGVYPADEFALGYRPVNGWMENYTFKIYNGDFNTMISASMSNTSEQNPFLMDEINEIVLEPGENVDFEIAVNQAAAPGAYTEEFTLFYTTDERDIMTIPVTANFYEAVAPDMVETPGVVDWDNAFTPDMANVHPNYRLYGMDGEMMNDAVYMFELEDDYIVSGSAVASFFAIYNDLAGAELTEDVEPYIEGDFEDQVLLAGTYYLVVAGNTLGAITMTREEIPAPEEVTYIAPENTATNVEAPVTLTWEGGANATEYQVLFGTFYPPTQVALDWTMVDEDNFGSYIVESVASNTQYFWQINVRNSHGTIEGPVWGFTTTLIAPNNVTASETEIFVDESTLIKWKLAGQGGFEGEVTVCDGTETSSYIPVYGLWMDDYTRGEMIYPAEMLEEMEGGEITSITYYISSAATGAWTGDIFNVYLMEVPATTMSAYYTSANATIVYTGALDGQGTTMTINFTEPYTYDGGNLLVGIEETTCSTWKSCSFYGVTATGASASGYNSSSLSAVTFNQRDFLPKTTFVCGGAKSDRDLHGFNVYYGDVKANTELIQERQYLLEDLPYNMDGHDVTVTAVYDEGESALSAPVVVYVSGYGELNGTVTELISGATIPGVNVKFFGKDEFNNTVSYETTTNASGYYEIEHVKAGNYTGVATLEGNEPSYTAEPVVLAYEGEETVDFVMHEEYKPVLSVYAEELDPSLAKVQWSLNEEITGGGNGGGGGTGGGSTTTYDFEDSSLQGWTTIDGGTPSGYGWILASNKLGTGYGHNASTDCVLSQSYDNNYGVVYPDNYLISPAKAAYSQISFWACGQDASYAGEHFGVAVSTTTATASAFTTIQEWTMTAKGSGVMAPGRDGQVRAQGNWYEYTVDLSSYAGQDIYVAIRHFNCSDMFYLDVDDITLTTGSKNRAVQNYTIVRQALLKETALVEADSVMLAEGITDTLYADFTWNNMEPGLYRYGVSAHYPIPAKGNRAETLYDFENGQIPVDFDNTISTYPWTVVDGNGGKAMKSSNGGVASSTSAISLTFDFPSDGTFSFDAECKGEGTSTFWDKCTFKIDGEQMFQCGANVTGWNNYSYPVAGGSHVFEWSYTKDGSVNPTGDYFMVDNVKCEYEGGGGDTNDDPITPLTWSNILPKDMEAEVTVKAIVAAGSAEGATVTMTNTFEDLAINVTLDSTGMVTFEDFRKGNYVVTVDLEGYTSSIVEQEMSIWSDSLIEVTLTEICKPTSDLAVSKTGFARWTNIIPDDRLPERYFVTLNNALVGETDVNFFQFEDLEEGTTYTAGVAVVYTTGLSEYIYDEFTYEGCGSVDPQVEDLEATSELGSMDVILTWNGGTPTPPTPPTPGQGEFYDFEDGTMQGWTSIDADGDGYTWNNASQTMGTGYGHNGSSNMVYSQSYDNNYGVLYPDNYLVSPNKAEFGQMSFYACAQDASYAAEHFGVAVSTTTNTSASAFTMVQEWTMTAKGSGIMAPGRDGQTRAQGNWYEYTVDLSAYAGQEIYIAIRHFNCSDMFYLDVDDITLGEGGSTPPTPPTPPTGDTYDFETGLQGWTTIDGGTPSGYGWVLASTKLGTGYGHNGSSDCVLSQSYDNNYGVVYPDNYLISPAKAAYTGISFYACAQDASYAAEHFGVAVSTTTATASAFTMVQEWTMTSKGSGVMAPGRDGQVRAQGNWYQYTVDLSSYAGQEIYVAIRHFNCSDMFYLDVDDITLATDSKSVADLTNAGQGFGYINNNFTDDGQWYYYDNGTNSDAIGLTSGGSFYWGVMFPAGSYSGNRLTKVAYFDYTAHTGTVLIYQGGTSAPGTQVYSQPYSVSGTSQYVEIDMTEAVELDETQNVWVVMHNNNGQYVAAIDGSAGVNYGSCLSTDGSTWYTNVSQASSSLHGNWNLRAYIETGGSGPVPGEDATTYVPGKYNILVDGEVVGATDGTSFTYTCEDYDMHLYEVVYVDADYAISCPAEVWYQILPLNVNEIDVVNAIYPNPTSGDLHINAEGMNRISIVNTLGQVVYDRAVKADETVINMAQFENGVYMVRVATVNGTSVKRVVVSK